MKFGVFFEVSVPRPLTRVAEQDAYRHTLEQARLADQLGFDSVWAVEHHFLEEYSHCSAPEVLLAAIAAQTSRIRVGHGAVVCVPEMNHPIRVAERAAVLDIISGGRVELGTARSSTWTELGGFQADPDATKKVWDEYVRVLPRLWGDDPVSHEGLCFSMPERSVVPKPVQKPHPPLWVTVTSPGTELDAADRGIGCLGVAAAGLAEQERRTREYFRRIEQCEPVSSVVNAQVATLNFLYCHEDDATAVGVGLPMLGLFALTNAHLLSAREAFPTRAYQSLGNLAPSGSVDRSAPGDQRGIPEGMAIGDPQRCTEAIKRWEGVGVTGINFIINAIDAIPQAAVLDSLRLFAREVMPHFRKREPH